MIHLRYFKESNESNEFYDVDWVIAIQTNNIDKIEYMIENGYDINKIIYFEEDDEDEDAEDTALNYASFYKKKDVVDVLLKYDADLGIIINKSTTLMKSCYNSHYDDYSLIKKILERTPKKLLMLRNIIHNTFIDYLHDDLLESFKKDYSEIYSMYEKSKKADKFKI